LGEIDGIKAHVDTRLLKGIIEVEDTADATITFKNGSSCLFFATNNYAADSPVEIEIICEKAVIHLKDKLMVKYSDGTSEILEEIDRATGEKVYWGCSHKYLIRDFHEKIRNGKSFELNGEQGIKAIRIIEAINRSSETGEYIKF
jgi:predicted dehydrogenase